MGGSVSLINGHIDDYGNYCVCCGAIIPEGTHTCPNCERKLRDQDEYKADYKEGQCD